MIYFIFPTQFVVGSFFPVTGTFSRDPYVFTAGLPSVLKYSLLFGNRFRMIQTFVDRC
jgi:hypothetical protein